VFLAKYDDKIINIPYRNVYQRTWKLVDCKIYNSSTRGKSIQNQSTTPFGRCGLTLDWFTTREIVIDFAIHQLSGPLISTFKLEHNFDEKLDLHFSKKFGWQKLCTIQNNSYFKNQCYKKNYIQKGSTDFRHWKSEFWIILVLHYSRLPNKHSPWNIWEKQ